MRAAPPGAARSFFGLITERTSDSLLANDNRTTPSIMELNNRNFRNLLRARRRQGHFLNIELAPNRSNLPVHLLERNDFDLVTTFVEGVVAATKDVAGAYQLDIGSLCALGPAALVHLSRKIRMMAPGIPFIGGLDVVDARGWDKFVFEVLNLDAVTVNPSFGMGALAPFLARPDKGVFVHCYAHDAAANHSMSAFRQTAQRVVREWNDHHNCGILVTRIPLKECRSMRSAIGDMPMLLHGVEAKDIPDMLRAAKNSAGGGVLLTPKEDFLHAFSDKQDFASHIGAAAAKLDADFRTVLQKL